MHYICIYYTQHSSDTITQSTCNVDTVTTTLHSGVDDPPYSIYTHFTASTQSYNDQDNTPSTKALFKGLANKLLLERVLNSLAHLIISCRVVSH